MSTVEFRLRRPNADTPWGFRLQGGLEVNSPLTIQRVFNGSPADGNLQRGDVLLSINGNDVSAVYLKKAEELVKAASNYLTIAVRRTGQPVNSPQPLNEVPFQQPLNRQYDSSPLQPKYDHQARQQPAQVPASFGSTHHQPASRPLAQSNVWRPSAQSTDGYGDSLPSSGGGGYQPVKNQWQPSAAHHAADTTGVHGNQWPNAAVPAAGPAAGSYHSTGHGHTLEDDQLFPPFSNKSSEVKSVQPGIGATQNYAKQQKASPSHVASPHPVGQGSHPVQHQQPTDEEDVYEQKSVRDIKQMFSKSSKPPAFGSQQASKSAQPSWQKPSSNVDKFSLDSSPQWNAAAPTAKSTSFTTVSQSTPPATKPFVSPTEPNLSSSSYYGDLYGDYPPPRQDPSVSSQSTGLITARTMTAPPKPKPGAGYSYQGIVTVTPAKTVHGKGKPSGGSSGQGTKKKEFDPSQSLVFLALQEENERAKRGEAMSPEEEAPPRGRPQQAASAGNRGGGAASQQSDRQRSARLQELLDRDQAQSQQRDEAGPPAPTSAVSPHLSAQARREMSPSFPKHQQHFPQQQQQQQQHYPQQQQQQQQQYHQQQQYQQKTSPAPQRQQHYSSATSHQQHQYEQSFAPAHGYQQGYQQPQPQQQQQYQSYYGGFDSYGGDNGIPISDF